MYDRQTAATVPQIAGTYHLHGADIVAFAKQRVQLQAVCHPSIPGRFANTFEQIALEKPGSS